MSAPYAALKDLKAGDNVVIIPVDADHDGEDFEVAEAYEPETVSGTLTGVKDYGPTNKAKNAVSLTVGGTDYSISLWNKDIRGGSRWRSCRSWGQGSAPRTTASCPSKRFPSIKTTSTRPRLR